MPTVSDSIWVSAPPERVWALVAEPRRYPEWMDFMEEVTYTSEGPVRADYVYRGKAKQGRKVVTGDWRITECDPPRLLVHRGAMSDMEAELRTTLEPDREGTLWFHEMEYRLMPRFRPMGWLLEKLLVQRQMQATFARIMAAGKRLVEEGAPAPSGGTARPS